jgi:hypothetical protein
MEPSSSITDRSKENQQLHAVVLPYLTSVSILLAISLALAGILLQTNVNFGSRALEINFAGSRRSGTYSLQVLAQELIRNDSSTWPDTTVLRDLLLAEADENHSTTSPCCGVMRSWVYPACSAVTLPRTR